MKFKICVAVVTVLVAAACNDDQHAWWERQSAEISDEEVRDFCNESAARQRYCLHAADRLTKAVQSDLQDGVKRQVRIEWHRPADWWDATRLARSGVLCEPVVLDGPRCWTLNYVFIGDWSPPPRLVRCLTNGEPSPVGPSQFWWDPDDRSMVGCVYLEHGAWVKRPTGTAQVVVDGVASNILPSKGGP